MEARCPHAGWRYPRSASSLFAAADRVLPRAAGAGPPGLTTRAITAEAGVANGVLHRHFRDLDRFLAEFVASRLAAIAERPRRQLTAGAGQGTVAANLTSNAILALFGADALALMNLVAARPGLQPAAGPHRNPRGRHRRRRGAIFAAYLDAEEKLGRIAPGADTQALAFTLIGAVHHLVITSPAQLPHLPERVRRIVAALIAGMGANPG